MNKAAIIMITAVAVVYAAGCGSNTTVINTRDGAPKVVDDNPQLVAKNGPISDIPIPVGFKLDMKRSRDMTAGNARWVDHVYKGRGDRYAVRAFFRRQMPVTGWTLVTMSTVQNDIILVFEKSTERCTIRITKGSLFHPVYIYVQSVTAGRVESRK